MKTKLALFLLVLGNFAFADPVANSVISQQYVTATPATQPQLQTPFNSRPFNSTKNSAAPAAQQQQPYQAPSQTQQPYPQQAYQAPQTTSSPMAIYNSPAQTTQLNNSQYVPQPQQAQPYQQQAYNQPQYAPQPQYQQPVQQQDSQWHTRPQNVAQNQIQAWQGNTPNTQPAMQQQTQNYQQPIAQNYYATPQPTYPQQAYQAPQNNYAPPQSNQQQPYQQPIQQAQTYPQPTAPNYQQPTATPTPAVAPPQQPISLANDPEAQQTWYSNCLKAVTSKTMTPYANAFCQCGWQKIVASGMDPKMFTSQNPADIQKANLMLQGISQACLVQVMKGTG